MPSGAGICSRLASANSPVQQLIVLWLGRAAEAGCSWIIGCQALVAASGHQSPSGRSGDRQDHQQGLSARDRQTDGQTPHRSPLRMLALNDRALSCSLDARCNYSVWMFTKLSADPGISGGKLVLPETGESTYRLPWCNDLPLHWDLELGSPPTTQTQSPSNNFRLGKPTVHPPNTRSSPTRLISNRQTSRPGPLGHQTHLKAPT